MQPDKSCAVRVEPSELHQRIKELEDEMRPHDPDEGYEWPGEKKPTADLSAERD